MRRAFPDALRLPLEYPAPNTAARGESRIQPRVALALRQAEYISQQMKARNI
jgi:hypothetical protein